MPNTRSKPSSPFREASAIVVGILSEQRLQRLKGNLLMKCDLANILQEDKTDYAIEGLFVVGHHL